MAPKFSYKPLPSTATRGCDSEQAAFLLEKPIDAQLTRFPRPSRRLAGATLVFSILLNVILIFSCTYVYDQKESQNPNLFWTPFNSRLKYHVQRFTSGFGDEVSIYQGPPSPQRDADWQALYVEGFTIPKSDARRLVNKTVPVTTDADSEYLTSFSVFHYIHCLDMIRKVTEHIYHPEYHNITSTHNPFTHGLDSFWGFEHHGTYEEDHIGHCIDSLRQALMCKPDLGPVVWQWVPWDRSVKVWAQTAHTCANYDELLEFAKQREYTDDFVADQQLEMAGQCGYFDEDCGFKAQ